MVYSLFMNLNSGIFEQAGDTASAPPRWDFLTSHAHVLLCVAQDPGIRLRDIAAAVGITERSAHKILSELVEEGYVLRERNGRRNRYKVKPELRLRHPLVKEREVGPLLDLLMRPSIGDRNAYAAQEKPFSGIGAKGSAG
jgi:DNA-binding MarR family transcriptional regulator